MWSRATHLWHRTKDGATLWHVWLPGPCLSVQHLVCAEDTYECILVVAHSLG